MGSTLAVTLLIQAVAKLGEAATVARIKELGWSQYEIDQAVLMGLLELLADGRLRVVE